MTTSPAQPEPGADRLLRLTLAAFRVSWPVLALAALVGINMLQTPGFAHVEWRDGRLYGAMIDILRNGSIVILLAVGMAMVIGTGGIDLSVGSIMALAGAAAALLMTEHGAPVPYAISGGLAVGAIVGLFNGVLVTFLGLQPIVATLVTLVAGRGLAQALTNDQKVRFEVPAFEQLGSGAIYGIPTPAVIAAAVALAAILLLRFTVLGMYIQAVGGNPRAARLCGLPVHRLRLAVYCLAGLCASAAGLIAAADIKEADVANCGRYLELDAILAVVIGGTSLTGGKPRILGAILGALLMQTLTTTLQMRGVPTERTLVIKAVVALAVCSAHAPRLRAVLSGGSR